MQKVKLNIVPKGVKKTTYLSQNDNGRVVRYELFNELIPYILDGSETITLKVVRPDGEEILANIENTFEGEAYIDVSFNDDMSAITGVGAGEIKITDGETELGSHNFDINVEIDAYNGKDVVIETETGTLLSFNTEVEDNALEYESEIPYNAAGYTGLRVINTRTAPVYDKTPYLFRKTPSGYGNSCIEKLNGLSVAFNQLLINGNFATLDGWSFNSGSGAVANNKLTFTITEAVASNSIYHSLETKVIQGHKYFVSAVVTPSKNAIFQSRVGNAVAPTISISANTRTNIKNIIVGDDSETTMFMIYCNRQVLMTVGDTCVYENVFCIDLTQMFGSTIADYIYNLETAQAGAGVAYFKNLFGADYYPFNAGELMSVKTSGRKTVGFNQFDEETEIGGIDDITGNNYAIANRLRSKNFIPVNSNETYYLKMTSLGAWIYCYDMNKSYIAPRFIKYANNTFTLYPNTAYIRLELFSEYGTTYNHDICINISDSERNGEYEPYNAVTYPLDPDLELRGIPKLDANNKLYGDGDIYESSGDVTRRYNIVALDSLTWTYISDAKWIQSYVIPDSVNTVASGLPNAISNIGVNLTDRQALGNTDLGYTIYAGRVYVRGVNLSEADLRALIAGKSLIYEKATPTSESADPYTDPQEARITEEFIDDRAIPIPVAQDTIYGTDIEYQDIDFNTTIYGGEIDAVNGVLSSEYNSDGSVKPTPEIIDITPTPIPVKAGDNKIFNTANGNQTIRYYNQVEE